jgi:WD40 repeat protein
MGPTAIKPGEAAGAPNEPMELSIVSPEFRTSSWFRLAVASFLLFAVSFCFASIKTSLAEPNATTSESDFHIAASLRQNESVTNIAWSPDGNYLATANFLSRKVTVWDVNASRVVREIYGDFAYGGSIGFTSDGRYLLASVGSYGDDRPASSITVWDIETGKIARQIDGLYPDKGPSYNAARIFALSPDGRSLAVVGEQKLGALITLYDVSDWRFMGSMSIEGETPRALAFNSDGSVLAVGTIRGQITLFDARKRQIMRKIDAYQYKGFQLGVASLAFSPDGHFLASGAVHAVVAIRNTEGKLVNPEPEDLIRIWNADDGTLAHTISSSFGAIHDIAWSSDGRYVASASADRVAKLWRPDSTAAVGLVARFKQAAFAVAFSRNGNRMAATGDNIAIVVDVPR